jgi:hypothetical protein
MTESRLYYITAFSRSADKQKEQLDATKEWLEMDALLVQDGTCVEMGLLSKIAKTQEEWEEWWSAQAYAKEVSIQFSTLVAAGPESEACVERLIEKMMTTNTMESQFLDAYRVVSDGKMHFHDGRNWRMNEATLLSMSEACAVLRLKVHAMWQKRFTIAAEIDAARDVMALSERMTCYKVETPDCCMESGIHSICKDGDNSKMMFQLVPLFDWDDIRVLEDKEADVLVEVDNVTQQLRRTECVLERQRALKEWQSRHLKKKRTRALVML